MGKTFNKNKKHAKDTQAKYRMTNVPEMKKESEQLHCLFCGGRCIFRYGMGEYAIWQCQQCKTGRVWPMPTAEALREYYDNFLPHLDVNEMFAVKLGAKKLFPHLGLRSGRNLKMLDIGGGGGFFCKAFEDLGYGASTYVDLDPQSCNFAENSLKLKRVFNCDAMDIKEYINTKFDFIYSRHVIEHLLDPTTFIERIMEYLNDNGIFVVQFPNGNSLEYLAYPNSTIRHRLSSIRKTNEFSKLKVFWIMLTGGMLHGIDPPRHLWAITGRGVMAWASAVGGGGNMRGSHISSLECGIFSLLQSENTRREGTGVCRTVLLKSNLRRYASCGDT